MSCFATKTSPSPLYHSHQPNKIILFYFFPTLILSNKVVRPDICLSTGTDATNKSTRQTKENENIQGSPGHWPVANDNVKSSNYNFCNIQWDATYKSIPDKREWGHLAKMSIESWWAPLGLCLCLCHCGDSNKINYGPIMLKTCCWWWIIWGLRRYWSWWRW